MKINAIDTYFNRMQMIANLADTTNLIAEVGRGGGKTDGILGPRSIRVAYDMPGSLLVLAGPTYVSLLQNIVPNLLSYYRRPLANGKTILTEGVHYVKGTADLPKHFKQPIFPLVEPKHTISTVWGSTFRLVSADRPESAAGISAAHAFVEEMKHIEGKKLKSRVFPALRGNRQLFGNSHYFQGITGISDTARIDLGEDDWFQEYEVQQDKSRISDIINTALFINRAQIEIIKGINVEQNVKLIERWTPRLVNMRKGATTYLRFSSFINKDVLGLDYFLQRQKDLDPEEFLSSIANVRPQKVADMFFAKFEKKKHTFSDSYKYDHIDTFSLEDKFIVTDRDLKYRYSSKPLIAGYDPGGFQSMVVAQKFDKELKIIKNFFVYSPESHTELAKQFAEFFSTHKEKVLILYYDRAGNQQNYKNVYSDSLTDTDAIILQRELSKLGWTVKLMSKKQRTIYYWEHYTLLNILFGERDSKNDKIRICEHQCSELVSSILISPLIRDKGKVELDKKSEKLPYNQQATRSTQIASALMYLLFGLYEHLMPSGTMKQTPDYDTYIL